MKPCHNHVSVTVMQLKYLIAVIWVNTKERHMPGLDYPIPATAYPQLFPNNIQSDSRLASNTPLGVFSKALMAWLHTMHASLPSWLLPSETSQKIRGGGWFLRGSTNPRTGTLPHRWGKAGSSHCTEISQRAALHQVKCAASVCLAGWTSGGSVVFHLQVVHSETSMR